MRLARVLALRSSECIFEVSDTRAQFRYLLMQLLGGRKYESTDNGVRAELTGSSALRNRLGRTDFLVLW